MSGLRPAAVLAAAVAAWGIGQPARAFPVETLQANGPPEQRLDLVILGDGYRLEDQARLTSDAQALVTGLFNFKPYKDYRALVNVKLIHVASKETGADNGTYGQVRDTALGAYFNCAGIQRLLCVDYTLAYTIAAQDAPEYDVLVVVVNDPLYGGSGGAVAAVSTDGMAVGILRHELGHTLAGLADEYEDPNITGGCDQVMDCSEPNVTVRTTRAGVKWSAWIEPATPVPTPESTGGRGAPGVGAFEGGRYVSRGVYRPVDQGCIMRSSGAPFCPVCAESMARSFFRYASPIERQIPAPVFPAPVCHALSFGVEHLPVDPGAWTFAWTVDGTPSSASGPVLDVRAGTLAPGNHVIQVRVQDGTALVRNDPDGMLQETATWQVFLTPCASCQPGAACGTPLCADGQVRPAPVCNNSGQCIPDGASSCGGYACDDQGAACRTACASASDCVLGFVCRDAACVSVGGKADSGPGAEGGDDPPAGGCGCGGGGGGGGIASFLLGGLLARHGRWRPRGAAPGAYRS